MSSFNNSKSCNSKAQLELPYCYKRFTEDGRQELKLKRRNKLFLEQLHLYLHIYGGHKRKERPEK